MRKNPSAKKVMVITVVTMSILMTGCTANQRNNMRQQGTQMQQQQQQQPWQQQQAQQPRNVDNRVQVANEAANKVAEINGVQRANVLVTQRNAYVGAVLDNNGQLTGEIENQIANQVKATDPNIQNVYVSTSPELVDRFNSYVADIQQGRPVAGFVEQFNEITQRIFPNAR
jgi:YhcN/YlaJ family sporulation lipoprotein